MEVGGVVGEAEQRLCPQHAYHDSRLRQPEANNADPAPAQMKLENDERQEDEGCEEQNAYDEYDEEEEEEEEVIMDEEELLRMLDKVTRATFENRQQTVVSHKTAVRFKF